MPFLYTTKTPSMSLLQEEEEGKEEDDDNEGDEDGIDGVDEDEVAGMVRGEDVAVDDAGRI